MFPSTYLYVHFGYAHKNLVDGNAKMCINVIKMHIKMNAYVSTFHLVRKKCA